jgi:hypothetical protein
MAKSTTTLDRLHAQLSVAPSGDVDVLRRELRRMTTGRLNELFRDLTSEAGEFSLDQKHEGTKQRLGLIAEDIRIALEAMEQALSAERVLEQLGNIEHWLGDAKILAAFMLERHHAGVSPATSD